MLKRCVLVIVKASQNMWVNAGVLPQAQNNFVSLGIISRFILTIHIFILGVYAQLFNVFESVINIFYPLSTGLIVSTTKEIKLL